MQPQFRNFVTHPRHFAELHETSAGVRGSVCGVWRRHGRGHGAPVYRGMEAVAARLPGAPKRSEEDGDPGGVSYSAY
uniref:Uncharacterized protein n=1 Tax=Knipowitschia caucasica TaxID=637954 RepID=A0AAV2MIC6_KNICA